MKEKKLVFKEARENPKEYWNKRSNIFFNLVKGDIKIESENILKVLTEKNVNLENLRVLDVGCGFGRHLNFFKNIAKECVGTDISEEMLKLVKEYIDSEEKVKLYCVDWNDDSFSLKDNKFDIAFSSMCQAIESRKSLKKLIEHSSNYCMIERYLREDTPLKEIYPKINENRPVNDWEYSQSLISLLWDMGYYPESRVYSYDKEVILSLSEFEEIKDKLDISKPLYKEILDSIKEKGEYKYKKHVVKILIYWGVKERRK